MKIARYIKMHEADNVAIVVNDGGLPAGSAFEDGLVLVEGVPQGHKVALTDLAEGDPVTRYNVTIGYADQAIPRGSWVSEKVLRMPGARVRFHDEMELRRRCRHESNRRQSAHGR